MPTHLNPYLSFKENAREAMEFYKTIFGGTIELHTFAEFHASEDPAEADKIMHGMLTADNGIVFMASDTPNSMEYQDGARISMSLSGEDEAELRGFYDKLAEGGTVTMPMDKAPWGDIFGMVMDKFGILWMINVIAPK